MPERPVHYAVSTVVSTVASTGCGVSDLSTTSTMSTTRGCIPFHTEGTDEAPRTDEEEVERETAASGRWLVTHIAVSAACSRGASVYSLRVI